MLNAKRLTEKPQRPLQTLMIPVFFAFIAGAMLSTLMQRPVSSEADHANDSVPIFTLMDRDYYLKELPDALRQSVLLAKENECRALLAFIYPKALDILRDTNNEQFNALLVPPVVSEAEVEAFWQRHEHDLTEPFFALKSAIHESLLQYKRNQQQRALVARLAESHALKGIDCLRFASGRIDAPTPVALALP